MFKSLLALLALSHTVSAFACGYGNVYSRLECVMTTPGKAPVELTLNIENGRDIGSINLDRVASANLEVSLTSSGQSELRTVIRGRTPHFQTYVNTAVFSTPVQCDVAVPVLDITRTVQDVSNQHKTVTLKCFAISYFDQDKDN